MARRSKKDIVLEIMKDILKEYKEVRHKTDRTKCGLCVKYINQFNVTCENCPMIVFKGMHCYPCINRKCEPVNCSGLISPDNIDLQRVIKFYKQAIAKIESMSVDAVRKSSFKFLIKIDKEVYN